jgi:hypothetical protein
MVVDKVYIVWKTSVSGWSKEIIAIYKSEKLAHSYVERNSKLWSMSQYSLSIETKPLKD